ncbi:MAG: glycosyltransferase [Ferruginibacter sp.]
MPAIFFTVTTDLSYDQRMIRICTSLANAGYEVTLVGRRKGNSVSLSNYPYRQERLNCWFEKGKLFYAEYNIRLFFFLIFKKMDAVCAIDLDTILPCYYISKLKKIKRIYDAHEYFSQQKEIITRPLIYRIWHGIEKRYLPKFPNGYTVGNRISTEFRKMYGVNYEVIRNIPWLKETIHNPATNEKIILYQGAVNEARGFEFLIPAMQNIEAVLHIYGDGNFMEQAINLIKTNNLHDKVFMKGKVLPGELEGFTRQAYIGINLVENTGLNQYYSLANKFFDLIHHGIPQVTMNYPEYKMINDKFTVALLLDDMSTRNIEKAINLLLKNESLYQELHQNCLVAAKVLNWQNEEIKLLSFYKNIFG